MTLSVFGQPQAVGEQAEQVASGRQAAQQGQARLRLQTLEDQAQRLTELVAAEILQAGLPVRRLEQRALFQTDGVEAHAVQAPARGVGGADDGTHP